MPATLAAMVFVAVVGLIDVPAIIRLAQVNRPDFWTAPQPPLSGSPPGCWLPVAVGVVLTLLLILTELSKIRVTVGSVAAPCSHSSAARCTPRTCWRRSRRCSPPSNTDDGTDADGLSAVRLDLGRMATTSVTVLDALADLNRELATEGVCSCALRPFRMPRPGRQTHELVQRLEADGRAFDDVESGSGTRWTAAL